MVNGEATAAAEESLGKALLTPETALLRLASQTQLVGRWFFEIKYLRNVVVAVWKPI
jgi:hypothetical protein